MFVCTKCGKTDCFELMINPNYEGSKKVEYSIDKKGNINIKTDGHSFIPDLNFMNNHAVCSYCGSIYNWSYSKRSAK